MSCGIGDLFIIGMRTYTIVGGVVEVPLKVEGQGSVKSPTSQSQKKPSTPSCEGAVKGS